LIRHAFYAAAAAIPLLPVTMIQPATCTRLLTTAAVHAKVRPIPGCLRLGMKAAYKEPPLLDTAGGSF